MGNGWEEEKQGTGHREVGEEELGVEGGTVGRDPGFGWTSVLGLRCWHQRHLGLSPGLLCGLGSCLPTLNLGFSLPK